MLHQTIARLYECGSPEEEFRNIALIVPLSYSTTRSQLTKGSYRAAYLAGVYQLRFPNASIAFTNAIHSGFEGCDSVEDTLKRDVLWSSSILSGVPSAHNSITEAEVIRDNVGLDPGSRILVICGEMHSRRVRYIWQKVFPDMVIVIRTFSVDEEYQFDHPARAERTKWCWIAFSITLHLLTRLVGINGMRRFRHITAQTST